MGCLGDLTRWLGRGTTLVRKPTIMAQNRRRIRRVGPGVLSLEPQHVLAGTNRRRQLSSTTCRRRKRLEIRPEKLRSQQPLIGLVPAVLDRRGLVIQPKLVKPRGGSAGYESVAARRILQRRRQARYPPKRARKRIQTQSRLGHPRREIQPRFPCLR